MRRKKWMLIGAVTFFVVMGTAGTLLWALLRVPDWYQTAAASLPPDIEQRKEAAKQLVQETTNLVNNIKHEDQWQATFRQSQVNSWFAEELRQEKYADVIPEGVSDPRLVILDNHMQLGFRYQKRGWSGIVSLQIKPWIQTERQLAVEIQSIRAGIVPIPLEELLQELAGQLNDSGWDVTWNHSDGNDVAVIGWDPGDNDVPILESLILEPGEVHIQGRRKPNSAE